MAAKFCTDLMPAMDSVMPGSSCLTAFAKKKVALEMQRKLIPQHNGHGDGDGDVMEVQEVPGDTAHRRHVDESRTNCSFERQPSRCSVVVIQDFSARTDDEASVRRGEQVKLLFIEGEWAYICKKVQLSRLRRLSKAASITSYTSSSSSAPPSSSSSSAEVAFGYIPQSHCRPLTDVENEQKRSRRRRAIALGSSGRPHDIKMPSYGCSASSGGGGNGDDDGDRTCQSPTPSAFVNPYLQLELLPSGDEDEDDSDGGDVMHDAIREERNGDGDFVEEWRYSFSTLETTATVVPGNPRQPQAPPPQHHRRQGSCESAVSSSSSSCHSENCASSSQPTGNVITYPGMMMSSSANSSPAHDRGGRDPEPNFWRQQQSSEEAVPRLSAQQSAGTTALESTGARLSFPYPAMAMFDFNGDDSSGNANDSPTSASSSSAAPTGGKHLSVRKCQLLTVFDFACDTDDWVLACTEDGRIGTLPFCFAKRCDAFPGFPHPFHDVAVESDAEPRTRPGTDMRRLNSQQMFYCDTASLASDTSLRLQFGREAPDGQSVDLQRMHSATSSEYSKAALSALSSSSSTHIRGSHGSQRIVSARRHPDNAPLPAMPSLIRSGHVDLDDDEFPAPPSDLVEADLPVISPHDPAVPEVISLLGGPRRGTSPKGPLSPNLNLSRSRASMRCSSTVNLRSRPVDESCLDLRAGHLSKGMSEVNLLSSSKGAGKPGSPVCHPRHSRSGEERRARGATPVAHDRSCAVPDRPSSVSLAQPASAPPASANTRFTYSTNETRRQRVPLPSPSRTPSAGTTATHGDRSSKPPFMGSALDVTGASQTLPSRRHSSANGAGVGRRAGRIESQDSAIGGSPTSSDDLLQSPQSRPPATPGYVPKINTHLVVRRDFHAKGDSQLSVRRDEVVVVADSRDHKDWLWVFAPAQRSFGFVPTVFTRER